MDSILTRHTCSFGYGGIHRNITVRSGSYQSFAGSLLAHLQTRTFSLVAVFNACSYWPMSTSSLNSLRSTSQQHKFAKAFKQYRKRFVKADKALNGTRIKAISVKETLPMLARNATFLEGNGEQVRSVYVIVVPFFGDHVKNSGQTPHRSLGRERDTSFLELLIYILIVPSMLYPLWRQIAKQTKD